MKGINEFMNTHRAEIPTRFDESSNCSDLHDDALPQEASAMIHEEVGKDPFIRDKGNVERITLAKQKVNQE